MKRLGISLVAPLAILGVLLGVRFRWDESVASGAKVAASSRTAPTHGRAFEIPGTQIASPEDTDETRPLTDQIPAPVAKALSNRWHTPIGLTATDLNEVSEATILAQLEKQTSPSNRTAIVSILAAIGGDQSAKRLISMTTDEFTGQVLAEADRVAMVNTAFALGAISIRSPIAKNFLLTAASESFWSQNRSWYVNLQNPESETYMDLWLARTCLKAIGSGGHEETHEIVQRILNQPIGEQQKWADSIVDAMFYLDRSKTRNGPHLPESGEDVVTDFIRWTKTDHGKRWANWNPSTPTGEPIPKP